jgi:LPXTG-motif cell wall-anchored protein
MGFNLWETLGVSREAVLAFALAGLVLAAAMAFLATRRRRDADLGLKLSDRD